MLCFELKTYILAIFFMFFLFELSCGLHLISMTKIQAPSIQSCELKFMYIFERVIQLEIRLLCGEGTKILPFYFSLPPDSFLRKKYFSPLACDTFFNLPHGEQLLTISLKMSFREGSQKKCKSMVFDQTGEGSPETKLLLQK